MATKEITKQGPRYLDPDLEHELSVDADDAASKRQQAIARISLVWQERRLIFRCIAVAFGVSTLIAFLIPVRYTSTTQLMPPDQNGQGMASMLSALKGTDLGSLGGDLLGQKTSADLFVGVLHSRTVEDDIIDKFDMRKVYGVRRYANARKILEDRTDVAAERKSGIITIKVSDHSPERAAGMAREYVAALNNVVINLNTSSAHKERVFLEERLGQVQKDLEKAEQDFSKFASQNTALDVKEQGRAMIGAAAELEGQLIAAETQLQGLQQIYTPENVRVRSMQARIEEYRRQLKKMGGKGITEASPDGAAAGQDSEQSEGATDASNLYPSIRQLPILGVTWADLYRNSKVQETVFETLTKQYELARVEEARETPSVKVLDPADVPEKKSFPPRIILILAAVFLTSVGSVVWVIARVRWEEIDSDDPRKILAQEVFETTREQIRKVLKVARKVSGQHSEESNSP
jgi:uncharacterized protein involved in exopolysaccharide biosynthesis